MTYAGDNAGVSRDGSRRSSGRRRRRSNGAKAPSAGGMISAAIRRLLPVKGRAVTAIVAVAMAIGAAVFGSDSLGNRGANSGGRAAGTWGAAAPGGAAADSAKKAGSRICAATWNVRWFPSGFPGRASDASEAKNITHTANAIRSTAPDIICLQEIRDRDAADRLAAAINLPRLKVAACSEFPLAEQQSVGQQNVILTTLRVKEAGFKPWTSKGFIDPPRGFAYAILEDDAGLIAVYNVHLKSNFISPDSPQPDKVKKLNRLKRELAAEQIVRTANAWYFNNRARNPRVIIAGDFNTYREDPRWKDEATLRSLERGGFVSCYKGCDMSAMSSLDASDGYPPVTFDYIYTKGFSAATGTSIQKKRWMSDHKMVTITLR